jgi:hypothetical protein
LDSVIMTTRGKQLTREINENSHFGRIHLYASWYKRLFSNSRSQLFVQLCKEQGYTVTKHVFDKDDSKSTFVDVKDEINAEIVNQTKKLVTGKSDNDDNDMINIENRKETLDEKLQTRKQMLHLTNTDLLNDKELNEIVCDDVKFNACIRSIMLYYTKEVIDQKELNKYARNFSFIEKSVTYFNILGAIEWLEKEFKFDRFKIADFKIQTKDISVMTNKMIEGIDHLQWICNENTVRKRKDIIGRRIKKLNSSGEIKKFIVDIINKYDDFYSYDTKRVTKKRVRVYVNFKFNDTAVTKHAKIINCLRMSSEKFSDVIKHKIIRENLIDFLE